MRPGCPPSPHTDSYSCRCQPAPETPLRRCQTADQGSLLSLRPVEGELRPLARCWRKEGSQANLYLGLWPKCRDQRDPLHEITFHSVQSPGSSRQREITARAPSLPPFTHPLTPWHERHKHVPYGQPPTLPEGHARKSQWQLQPRGHSQMPTLPLTPTHRPPRPRLSPNSSTSEPGGPIQSTAASQLSPQENLRGLLPGWEEGPSIARPTSWSHMSMCMCVCTHTCA